MRITRIELFRYIHFKHSHIELFEMDIVNNIQNIIGSNGSGKTSLLLELNPKPGVRTDYGDCGYKKIVIVHENSTYVLTSDFSNLSSPHSFVKDDEELNSSGTTSVQEELVVSHLGYTSQIHNICYGQFKLSNSQVGFRKTYLLTAHPCQMKLILDKHKKINTVLRAFRDNLSMLQERRASLASQLIDESIKDGYIEDKLKYENELGVIVEAIGRLNNQKNNIQKELNNRSLPPPTRSRNEIVREKFKYNIYYYIPREIPIEVCRNNTTNEIASLATKIENIKKRIRELTLEINKYEQHIKQNDAKGALESIETSISMLEMDVSELEKRQIDNPFDKYVLDKLPKQISQLTDLIAFFIGYNAPIPAMKDVYLLREKLKHAKEVKRYVDQEEGTLLEQLHHHEKTLTATLIDNIPAGCCECILFKNYRSSLSVAQSNYDKVSKELSLIQLRKKRVDFVIQGRIEKLSLFEQVVPQLQRISDYINENRYLLIALKDVDLLQTLRRNPTVLVVKIQNHFNLSVGYYELRKKKEALDKLILEQEKLKTPSEFGYQFLQQMVCEKHIELSSIRAEYIQLDKQKSSKEKFLSLLNAYEDDLNLLKRERAASQELESYRTLEHEIRAYTLYLDNLNTIKHQIVGRLTDIDRILKEQDAIMARYRDEVLVNIEKITKQEYDYAQIEKALAPTTGIAHKYMVQFLNDLFTDANLFMSEIFSYPVEFILLDDDTTLDFKFKMRISDVPIPDPSDASDGQKELIDFAFNLALSIQREQSHYGLFLDEVGRTFDAYHKQKMVEFLKTIVEDGLVSQLFLINHHATISAGMFNSDTIVLNPENVVVPEIYNEHVTMEKY